MDDHGAYLGAIVDGDMAKSTLFVLALLAVLGALGALLWSGRRARGERTAAPPATPADLASATLDAEAAAAQTPVSDVAAQLHQRAFGVPLTPPAQHGAHREVAGAVD